MSNRKRPLLKGMPCRPPLLKQLAKVTPGLTGRYVHIHRGRAAEQRKATQRNAMQHKSWYSCLCDKPASGLRVARSTASFVRIYNGNGWFTRLLIQGKIYTIELFSCRVSWCTSIGTLQRENKNELFAPRSRHFVMQHCCSFVPRG